MLGVETLGADKRGGAPDGLADGFADLRAVQSKPRAALRRGADVAHGVCDAAGGEGSAGQHLLKRHDVGLADLVEKGLEHCRLGLRGRYGRYIGHAFAYLDGGIGDGVCEGRHRSVLVQPFAELFGLDAGGDGYDQLTSVIQDIPGLLEHILHLPWLYGIEHDIGILDRCTVVRAGADAC